MKIDIRSCAAFLLLHVATHAISSPLQRSVGNFTKAILPGSSPVNNSPTDTSINVEKAVVTPDIKDNPEKIVTAPVATTHKDSPAILIRDTSFNQINTKLKAAALRMKQNTANLEAYVNANGFNTDYCFLVDMSIPSGKKRFFVYNIKKDSIEFTSLVAHGSGSYTSACNDQLVFSNTPNSNATSLGKYKIGGSYYGTWGFSYRLYGLDSTNNKAYERAIVLHSDSYVPENETYPRHIYESEGCPIVSPNFLAVLGKYIKTSTKPVLLWIYN